MIKPSKKVLLFFIFAVLNLILSIYLKDLVSTSLFEVQHYSDSSMPIYRALNLKNESAIIYDEVFFDEGIKYQYPPTALLPFYFMLKIKHLSFSTFHTFFSQITSIFYLISLAGIFIIFRKFFIDKQDSKVDKYLKYATAFLLAVTFFPLSRGMFLGQIQAWINCLLVFSIIFLMKNKEKPAGICLAFCILIKPTYALILLWAFSRKKWELFKYILVTVGIVTLISLPIFGIKNFLGYISVLSFLGRHGESFVVNQSFNGFLNRLLFNGQILQATQFPPFNKWVYIFTLVSSIILICASFFLFYLKKREKDNTLDFLILLLSITLASPIAWDHHYGFIIVSYMILFKLIFGLPPKFKKLILVLFVFSYFLMSHLYLTLTYNLYNTHYNFLHSNLLFGALILLGIKYYLFFKLNGLKSKLFRMN